ncbi:DUF4214 domain-containing protein [Massilia violaceinigra]|uniref:DUF4214 domain-containing protein n=1 Tax=Massilia violaceinigra TaxID=2045208 RepID=A0ABY4A798_9BURK|nr:DUF4214 domain-containing protein [Massilia violaceinigra]UOD29426.1 DUF4214 domain-containing protein [Massilia violaceinigra]
MPDYYTFDYMPDLSAASMALATAVAFKPFTGTGTLAKSDKSAIYSTSTSNLETLFSVQMTAGTKYHIFASSFFDPSLTLYDNLGNVISYSNDNDMQYGTDFIQNLVPYYTGTYYVSATLDRGVYHSGASVSFYEDDISNNLPKVSNGTSGADYFVGDLWDVDQVDGKAGIDTVYFSFSRGLHTLVKNGSDMMVIPDLAELDIDKLTSIERLEFSGETVNLDYTDVIQALYVGYFGRPADPGGFNSFQRQLTTLKASPNFSDLSARYNTDAATKTLIDSFGSSAESKALYSGDTASFVKAIYSNLLDRAPDAGGLRFWADAIDSGTLTRANASLSIMSGALSNTSAQGKVDAGMIGKKIDVAANFTFKVDGENKEAGYSGAAAAGAARALLANVSAWTDVLGYQKIVNAAVESISTTRPPADAPQDIADALAPFIGIDDQPHMAMYY